MSTTTTEPDYTQVLTDILGQLTIIAQELSGLNGGISGSFKRAMTVNALKQGNQLQPVINEMNNPTPLPGGA